MTYFSKYLNGKAIIRNIIFITREDFDFYIMVQFMKMNRPSLHKKYKR
ncbi:5245_t:CDS:2 [Gigaspora rosea]|nr:5245_t:CDS:2 [Gigaspora rosea]